MPMSDKKDLNNPGEAMKTIEYNGTIYTCTLSERFRRHNADELDAMRQSIASRGMVNPVQIYADDTLGILNCVLDGEGRLSIAAEIGAKVKFEDWASLTTEQAYEIAKVYNDDRRQDDPEEVKKRRAERIEKVTAARAEGKSLRAIAEEVGVSHVQVKKDLEESGVNRLTPDTDDTEDAAAESASLSPPPAVKGKDGKTYPATKPTAAATPDDDDEDDTPLEPTARSNPSSASTVSNPPAKSPAKKSKEMHATLGILVRYADDLARNRPKFAAMRDTMHKHLQAVKDSMIDLEKAAGVK